MAQQQRQRFERQLVAGVRAAQQGDADKARELLEGVLRQDRTNQLGYNELAWIWMAAAVKAQAQKRKCLQEALKINPANRPAREAINSLVGVIGSTDTINYAQIAAAAKAKLPQVGGGTGATPTATGAPRAASGGGASNQRFLLLGGAAAVIAILLIVSFAFSGNTPPPTPTPQPTATLEEGIVLPTATVTPSHTPNVRFVSPTPGTPFPTNTPTETPLPTETPIPTATLPPLTDFTVYAVSGGDQAGTLYRALGDGTGVQRLAENITSIDTRPGLNLIVFTRPVASGDGEGTASIVQAFIGTVEDIENAVQATRLTSGVVEAVSLSPDGSQIVYASTEDGDSELYLLNVQTGIVRKLSDNDSIDTQPVWSPDGTRIMFISDRDALGRTDVYVHNLADNIVTRLIDASGSAVNPRWSPDGTRIVYGDERGGTTSLVVTTGDGTGGRLLQVGDALEVTVPVWTADGRYLVYIARRENRADEIIFQSADTGERQGVIFPEMPNIADVAVR